MKKLHKLSILTIAVFCTNYGSALAQDEQKAFNEGDKVLSATISGGGSANGYGHITPSLVFDYGLKGTKGIVSIGAILSHTQRTIYGNTYGYVLTPENNIYNYSKDLEDSKVQSVLAGLRIGLHYSTRRFDFYTGTMVGYQKTFVSSRENTLEKYKITPESKFFALDYPPANSVLVESQRRTVPAYNYNELIFAPYIGARYYFTQKVGLNLEFDQYTGKAGLSFKF
jgi:hypothetical protein